MDLKSILHSWVTKASYEFKRKKKKNIENGVWVRLLFVGLVLMHIEPLVF